ncbi:hypothetical protein [Bathymodiolus septemdierum thioautotrophic gill symbiont]|uniref:Uncharacterized protein n=1 Tax=endosymbiont of Bathymodiolus septemdierum str. Myojin knoll TaxID=1303921 RepID=A0A0P0USJ2_9GAMM|nr:hypothetical protein [Bathymodiolus septemdierum thioautotrophic gill symbiont]BAS68229.1 conserved hypothetical protein [endosymbiont of Bathymodiolus septemdierum str. Myojin knoll]
MNKTEFLIGRSGLGLQDDFYPDDLPEDWRFDYYAAIFKTLSLSIDTDEDLDQIFADIQEDEEGFYLVLTIEESQLSDAISLQKLLSTVQEYANDFILFCEVSDAPSKAIMTILADYKVCFQSSKALKLNLKEVSVANTVLSFNQYPVLYSSQPWDDKKMRNYLESIASVNTKTILICKYAERDALDRMRIIAELLGY